MIRFTLFFTDKMTFRGGGDFDELLRDLPAFLQSSGEILGYSGIAGAIDCCPRVDSVASLSLDIEGS